MHEVPELEASVEIQAPAAVVWSMVSDVTRMPEWSPQVQSVRLRSGFDEVRLGTQFTNRNALGELDWVTHGEVTAFEPEAELAFFVTENWVTWRFVLTPTATGTLLTQRREAPDGISDLSQELTDGFLGGTPAFTQIMQAGMATTLTAIKTAAEAEADGG